MDRVDDGILWSVVEEHLDEAEFLWGAWEQQLTAPHLNLAELAQGTEARLLAHIDGLVLAAPAVVERLLRPALADAQRDRAAAACWAWLRAVGDAAVAPVCARLAEAEPPECRGIARALALWEGDVGDHVLPLVHASRTDVQVAALTVLAAHGRSPGPALAELAAGGGPAVRAACIPFAAPSALMAGLEGEFGEPGFDMALRAGLQRGLGVAREVAWASPRRRGAAQVLGSCGGDRGLRTLLATLAVDRGAALWGLGFTGRRAAADACAELLPDPVFGALAAESMVAIGGLDLVGERMTIRAARADADEDEAVPTPDDELPRPDVERVRAWWRIERQKLAPEQRYLYGAPATATAFASALERASMRRRPGLVMELALRTGGRIVIDPRWFSERQRRSVAGSAAARIDMGAAVIA